MIYIMDALQDECAASVVKSVELTVRKHNSVKAFRTFTLGDKADSQLQELVSKTEKSSTDVKNQSVQLSLVTALFTYQDILCGLRCHAKRFSPEVQNIIDNFVRYHNKSENLKMFEACFNKFFQMKYPHWVSTVTQLLAKSFRALGAVDRGQMGKKRQILFVV